MGIVDEDIERVRSATDFVALASEHVALKRVGQRWVALCPFHTEKSPSFSLNAQEGYYYCFGCSAKGDVITFVRELEHLDFVEAVEKLAARANITLRYDDDSHGRDHQRLARIYDTLARAVAWYHEQLLSGRESAAARHYLRAERGYDGEVVRRYQLGWAPEGWDRLLRTLKLPRASLVDAGLAQVNDQGRYADFFRGRLLFPIFDSGGRAIGAGGRILPGGHGPKYKNTTGTAVYDKSRVVYGLNWAKTAMAARDQLVMCEGYTDVIGLQRAGIDEAVATCGTALADGHIRLLTKFARRIVLAYDADAAGQAAAERYYEWEQRYDVEIRVAALPPGDDPADLAQRDPDALKAAIVGARPFLAFQLERLFARSELGTAEGRVRAAGAALALVGAHPNELVRDQYLMDVAGRCRIDPDRLRAMPVPAPAAVAERAGRRRDGAGDGRGRPDRGTDQRARSDERAGRRTGGQARDPAAGAGQAGADGGAGGGGRAGDDEAWGRPVPNRPPNGDDDPGAGATSPARLWASMPQPELAALRLAVHRPEEVADRLEAELFHHPLSRGAFASLVGAATLHEAIEAADPQTADLLQRLVVEDTEEDADDVMVRLVEVAARRAVRALQTDMVAAPSEDQADYARSLAWLKVTVEALRTPDGSPVGRSADRDLKAERRLVAWIVARNATADDVVDGDGAGPVGEPGRGGA